MDTKRTAHRATPFVLSLLVFNLVVAKTIPESSDSRPGNREELAPSVVYLHADTTKEIHYATGFIVEHEGHYYLVTAKHVITDTATLERHATLRGADGSPVDFKLTDITIDPKARWSEHHSQDVAAIALQGSRLRDLGVMAISSTDVRRIKYKRLDGDPSILVLGFPLQLGASTFSPIGRWTLLVSDEIQVPGGGEFLILNDPSVDGFSGAPAFDLGETPLGGGSFGYGPFACNGVVVGTIPDRSGGKFAAVVPAPFILEVIRTEANLRNRPERESERLGKMFEEKEAKP